MLLRGICSPGRVPVHQPACPPSPPPLSLAQSNMGQQAASPALDSAHHNMVCALQLYGSTFGGSPAQFTSSALDGKMVRCRLSQLSPTSASASATTPARAPRPWPRACARNHACARARPPGVLECRRALGSHGELATVRLNGRAMLWPSAERGDFNAVLTVLLQVSATRCLLERALAWRGGSVRALLLQSSADDAQRYMIHDVELSNLRLRVSSLKIITTFSNTHLHTYLRSPGYSCRAADWSWTWFMW